MDKTERLVTEFFKRRFPKKNLQFEKECGYFGEWVERFKRGSPEAFMDEESKKVYLEILNEGKTFEGIVKEKINRIKDKEEFCDCGKNLITDEEKREQICKYCK